MKRSLDELKAISCREWLRTADKVAVGIPTSAEVAVTHDKRLVLGNTVNRNLPAGEDRPAWQGESCLTLLASPAGR